MKSNQENRGVNRPVDSLGRITLVKEYRTFLRIEEGDEIEELLVDDAILIKKAQKNCVICNSKLVENNLINISDKMICNECMKKIINNECIAVK